jgi:hypothetical protein
VFRSRTEANLTIRFNSLPEKEDDVKLEVEVTKVFSQYGTVFIKIRRDHSRMPFAFCQYTVCWPQLPWSWTMLTWGQNDDDAKLAMKEGKGAMILGRPCRTEPAKANRKFRTPLVAQRHTLMHALPPA